MNLREVVPGLYTEDENKSPERNLRNGEEDLNT